MKYTILLAMALFVFGCDKKIHEANAPSIAPAAALTPVAPPVQLLPS